MAKIRERDDRLQLWEQERRRHIQEVARANRDFELKKALADLRLSDILAERGQRIRRDLVQILDFQTSAFHLHNYLLGQWEQEAYWAKAAEKERLHQRLHLLQLRDDIAQSSGPWIPVKKRVIRPPTPKTAPQWMVDQWRRQQRRARQAAASSNTVTSSLAPPMQYGPPPTAKPPGPTTLACQPPGGEVAALVGMVRR